MPHYLLDNRPPVRRKYSIMRNAGPRHDSITPATYVFGALMILLGALGLYMMAAWSEVFPLLTVFFYSVPANVAIALFPHEPVLIWYGKTQNLWQLSSAATLGTLLAGYLDYRVFRPVLNHSLSQKYKSSRSYIRAQSWFSRLPFAALTAAGFLPLPFYPFKFLAFASRYPLSKYLAAVAVGRFPRYFLLGLAGYALKIPNWILIASFAATLLLIYRKKVWWLMTRPAALFSRGDRRAEYQPSEGKNRMAEGINNLLALGVAARTARNLFLRRPIAIALEVSHNCTANCRHCDKGPRVDDHPVGAEDYRRVCAELRPAVIQIAGGEPLVRDDILEIVRALYRPGRPPLLALVTNASLLTMDKYHKLREAGISQFSISLDFPDNRHDDFRRVPGLFAHLNQLIPAMTAHGHGDITLNTCITRANYPYLLDIVKTVGRWGAKLNFSTYTDLRTKNDDYNLRHPEDTKALQDLADIIFSRRYNGAAHRSQMDCVMTGEAVFRRYIGFYEKGRIQPNCRTGSRFLVVNPDGRLTPCAMFIDERYDSLGELMEKFVRRNECGGCYVSIRANTEKPLRELLFDGLRARRLSRKKTAANNELKL
jgi:MoaA/NifB/PqqE/SkfB family radical SAM enzyme/membrane protein YqaA with SNARE-associated domain